MITPLHVDPAGNDIKPGHYIAFANRVSLGSTDPLKFGIVTRLGYRKGSGDIQTPTVRAATVNQTWPPYKIGKEVTLSCWQMVRVHWWQVPSEARKLLTEAYKVFKAK